MKLVLVVLLSPLQQLRPNEPVRQGLVSMTGTFIDTIVICTMTGLSIVLTGAWKVEGLEGVQVTTYAFQHGLPLPAKFISIYPDALSCILCIYNNPWMGLLQRTLSGIPYRRSSENYPFIQMALYPGSISLDLT